MNSFQRNFTLPQMTDSTALISNRLEKGGLAQVVSLQGGSRTWFALSCLGIALKKQEGDPPLSAWISDDAELYPEALHYYWNIPLSRMLLVKTKTPTETWRTTLDMVQTGLFAWVFLKTERPEKPTVLRKLQLLSEKNQTKVLLLCQAKLPHWTLKTSVEI